MANRLIALFNPFYGRGLLVGLLIVLAFVAHDAFMTVDAHASAFVLSVTERHRSHPDDTHGPHVSTAVPDRDWDVVRLTTLHSEHGYCGVAPDVVLSSESGQDAFSSSMSLAAMLPALETGSNAQSQTAQEPTRPSAVRRALLQVYRI